MMDHSKPANWVRGRADCRLGMKFQALVQILERDVEEFNGLPADQRRKRSFRIVSNGEGTHPIVRVEEATFDGPDNRPSVSFTVSDVAIRVNGGGVQFYVKPVWNSESRACRLHIDGIDTPYEAWEISQQALTNLFFG